MYSFSHSTTNKISFLSRSRIARRFCRALDDPPLGLAELRGLLLREHEWRVREGLV